MNLLRQLVDANPARVIRNDYHAHKVRPEFADSRRRLLDALIGKRKSIPQLAKELGKTYEGTRSAVSRFMARREIVCVREARIGSAGKIPALYTWNTKREGKMAQWDRFDICEAHLVLEWDFNYGGWLRERPSNARRRESTGVQLHRMQFSGRMDLSFENLTDNGKEIYLDRVLKWRLPIDADMKRLLEEMFVPEYLAQHRPAIWPSP